MGPAVPNNAPAKFVVVILVGAVAALVRKMKLATTDSVKQLEFAAMASLKLEKIVLLAQQMSNVQMAKPVPAPVNVLPLVAMAKLTQEKHVPPAPPM